MTNNELFCEFCHKSNKDTGDKVSERAIWYLCYKCVDLLVKGKIEQILRKRKRPLFVKAEEKKEV